MASQFEKSDHIHASDQRLSHEREVEIREAFGVKWAVRETVFEDTAVRDLLAEIDALREDVRQLSNKNAVLQEDLDLLARTRAENRALLTFYRIVLDRHYVSRIPSDAQAAADRVNDLLAERTAPPSCD